LLNEHIQPITIEQGFTFSKARESRDRSGNFTFIGGDARAKLIQGMPVINIITGELEKF